MEGSRTFDAQDATLDAVLASGKLDLISDSRLREQLAGWKQLVDDAFEEASDYREATKQVTQRISLLGGPWIADAETPFNGYPSLIAMASELPHPNFQAVADDDLLRHLLRSKRYYSIVYLLELLPLAEHASEVAAMLESLAP